MKRNHKVLMTFGLAIGLAVLWSFSGDVQAKGTPASSPTEVLKGLNSKVAGIIKKKTSKDKQDKQLVKVVNQMLNFKMLTQSAFGKYWPKASKKVDHATLTDDQQKEAVELLSKLIQRNYIEQIHKRQGEKYTVEYVSEDVNGNKATVVTNIIAVERHDEETEVVYKMVQNAKSKKWKVKDIKTDGVSLVQNYRSQFYKIIEKESDSAKGIENLLQKLRDELKDGGKKGI